ncbi:hypothetical protein Ciccas_002084 [Cichlidogyrus casuarinus]|uniref:G-protein coupled receptors family 1 profile domain-containing protein n=1 Tax=Cichlidogyrus casuarinus TaxID=1844966 RepID=A0ABD2QI81_9PLAT
MPLFIITISLAFIGAFLNLTSFLIFILVVRRGRRNTLSFQAPKPVEYQVPMAEQSKKSKTGHGSRSISGIITQPGRVLQPIGSPRSIFGLLLCHLSMVEFLFCSSSCLYNIFFILFCFQRTPILSLHLAQGIAYSIFVGVFIFYRTCLVARNMLIAYIAWRRHRAVIDPLGMHRLDTEKQVTLRLCLLYFLCCIMTLPRVQELYYEICAKKSDPSQDDVYLIQTLRPELEDASKLMLYSLFFFKHAYFVLTSIIPLCVILPCSASLLWNLRKRRRQARRLWVHTEGGKMRFSVKTCEQFNANSKASGSAMHDSALKRLNPNGAVSLLTRGGSTASTTRTVVILGATFILLESPIAILAFLNMATEERYSAWVGGSVILNFVDSVLNFFIYYNSVVLFRKSLLSVICCPIKVQFNWRPKSTIPETRASRTSSSFS